MTKKISSIIIFLLLFECLVTVITSASANSEASYSHFISEKNIKGTNGKYDYTFDAPANFGELLSASFSGKGNQNTGQYNNVTYDMNSNTIKVSFTLGQGIVKTVEGYKDNEERDFNQYTGNAVCRHSDGVRWQANGVVSNAKQPSETFPTDRFIYDTYDHSKKVSNGTIPYDFYYGYIDINGKFSSNKNDNVPYWIGADGTEYTQDQIDKSTYAVLDKDIKYPSFDGKNTTSHRYYAGDNRAVEYYTFTATELNKTIDKEGETATWLTPQAAANEKMKGYAECHQYSFKVFYHYNAKTKPIQNIEGTINIKYTTSDTPKLVATLKTEPQKVQFKDKDIPVKVTLTAKLLNAKSPQLVKNYIVYLRTKDNTQNLQPSGYKVNGNTLEITVSDTFTIPKSKLNTVDEYTEYFVGRAIAYVSNADKEYRSDLAEATTLVYTTPPVPPADELNAAVAIITSSRTVKLGEYVSFMGHESYSTNENGYITGYSFAIPDAVDQPTDYNMKPESSILTWYDTLGTKKALLYVEDNYGKRGQDFTTIEVIEPTIEATIKVSGTPKENRKLTVGLQVDTPSRYPLVQSKVTWTIASLDGTLDSHIKREANLKGKVNFDLLIKKAGEYLITAQVENTAGYKYEATYTLEIVEDEKPVVDYEFQQKVYRDPSNNNLATFELRDLSYSFDGDYIAKRNWYVIYDANNDGKFTEPRELFHTGNETNVKYQTNKVGKFDFILEAIEGFGEPTIEQYVTEEERRRTSTNEG